jgi:hypothetical protein
MITFTPQSHFLLLEPIEAQHRSIIRNSQTDARAYRVLAVGPGAYTDAGVLIPTRLTAGDVVLVDPKHTVDLWWGDHHFRVVAEKFVFGTLDGAVLGLLAARRRRATTGGATWAMPGVSVASRWR